jgi:hypothetical protein
MQRIKGLGEEYNSTEYMPTTSVSFTTIESRELEKDIPYRRTVSGLEEAAPLNVCLVGDSFRSNMCNYLSEAIEKFTVMNRYYFDPELVLEDKPDVLVYEIAERYLHQIDYIPGYNTMAMHLPE